MNIMDSRYLNTPYEHAFAPTDFTLKEEQMSFNGDNNAALFSWSQQFQPPEQPSSSSLDPNEFVSSLVEEPMWQQQQPQPPQQDNNTTLNNLFVGAPWNAQVHVPPTIKEEWSMPLSFPTTPIFPIENNNNNSKPVASFNEFTLFPSFQATLPSREPTPPSSNGSSGSNSPHSTVCTPPPSAPLVPQHKAPRRRKSAESPNSTRTYRRRASSHPSVASVVSLTAHEPVAHIIDGIEYITFLYSHDRLVKEYTVRTDVESVNLDDIPMVFRVQNAIYPRANVPRHEYDGNRWDYETTCNKLGWELCWLNSEQLCGRRGLIQRAVDAYRNRHAEMRSRRVTRQEKVANGTLRKRRAKKANSAIL